MTGTETTRRTSSHSVVNVDAWSRTAGGHRASSMLHFGCAAIAVNAQLYSFALPALVSDWGVSLGAAGALGSVSLLGFSLGPWIAGLVASRFDLVRTARLAIAWLSIFSLASAFARDLQQMLVFRGLMSLGLGTAWAAGAGLMTQACGPRHRARQAARLAEALSIGWGIAALVFVAVFQMIEAAAAWRAMFVLGLVPGLLAFRWTGRRPGGADRRGRERAVAVTVFFSRSRIRATLLSALIAAGIQGAYATVAAWLPAYLVVERGLGAPVTAMLVLGVVFGSLIGQAAAPHIAQVLGRAKATLILAGGALATLLALGFTPIESAHLLAFGALLGLLLASTQRILPTVLGDSSARPHRASAQAFAVKLGCTAGVIAPFLVGRYADRLGLGCAIGVFGAGALALALTLTPFLPRARGRSEAKFFPPTHVNP